MEEKPTTNRPSIPTWAWIILIVALIFGANALMNGSFNRTEEVELSKFMEHVAKGEITKIEVTGEEIKGSLNGNNEVETSIKANNYPGATVIETLEFHNIDQETINSLDITVNNMRGWNILTQLLISFLPFVLLIWLFTRGLRQMQSGGNSIFGFGRSKAKNINDGERPTVTFDDVAGVDEAKEEVHEVVEFLREPEKFVQVGARIPKGLLMVGRPGTGKTLLARAIAGEAGVPFFHISGSEFVEMFVGVGASRVRDLFNKAKENAPSIIFVDEIDAVGRQRGSGLGGGHDEREQTLNQILVEMDGFSNETNIIVIAATNRVDVLDPALLRPGRFDRKVIVDLPDVRGREAILRVHSRGKPLAPEIDLSDIARLTAGFAGADLENLMNEGAIFAARKGRTVITQTDLQEAFDRVLMGPERKSRVISDEEKETIAYHEAGHAVVSFNLVHSEPVQKITIIPRGQAGGYVMFLPEDRMLKSKEFFEDKIASALGGRAAEEVFFGQLTTGASGDLESATSIARAMIMRYGMSSELGLRTFGEQSGNPFLGGQMYNRDYSEDAAQAIDNEVSRIIEKNYDRALNIIKEHRDKLAQLAQTLIDVETLDRSEFEALMNA